MSRTRIPAVRIRDMKMKNSDLKTDLESLKQEQEKLIEDIKSHTEDISNEKVKFQHAEGTYSERVASIET